MVLLPFFFPMLRHLLILMLILYGFCAAGQPLSIRFTPAFHPVSQLTLTPGQDGFEIRLVIRPDAPSGSIAFSRWIPDRKRWTAMQNYLTQIKAKQTERQERQAEALRDTGNAQLHAEEIYADGAVAEARYGAFAFSFGPEKAGAPEIQLFNFISSALWTYCRNQTVIMIYWRTLENYFPHPFSFRKEGKGYILYGTLSANDENTRQLNALIDQFPANRPVVIDARYFNGMDTFYYPYFRRLLRKNKQISWIKPINGAYQPSSWGRPLNGRNQLNETGVSRFVNQ